MAELEIEAPSGLKGVLRGLKVRDEQLLFDKKVAANDRLLQELLGRAWSQTIDPGPYTLPDGPVDWDGILQGDAWFLLHQLRVVTYGPEYEFTVPCGACHRSVRWTVDLTTLPVKRLPEGSRQHVRTGEPFSHTLPNGRAIQYRLLYLRDERALQQAVKARGISLVLAALAQRVVSIEGIAEHRGSILQYLGDLDASDADGLREAFERVDCGVETGLSVECEACGSTQEVNLPFVATFFSARKWARSASRVTDETGSGP